ncbi:hypothetical protein AcW1_000792 [Taiwanofungus camphoratus]|nr:hypothetical protein AcW1_000792 [Antrodia cinnamomea]
MSSDLVLPGQPIPLPRGPVPQLGSGIYIKDGHVRASLAGVPQYEGSTLAISRTRPHPPIPNSVVLGSVTRLSPLQAVLSITVDVRATEKDKVKIADCFRGGDVVKGLVVCQGLTNLRQKINSQSDCRSPWVMLVVIM